MRHDLNLTPLASFWHTVREGQAKAEGVAPEDAKVICICDCAALKKRTEG